MNTKIEKKFFQQSSLASASFFILGTASVSLIFSCINPAFATPIPLREAIEQAQKINPDIRSLENQIDSLEAKTRQTLAPSTPSLSITYSDMTRALVPGSAASTVLQLNQPVAFPGKAWMNHSAIQEQSGAVRSQLRSSQLQVSTSIKTAYYQLALARKNIEISLTQKTSYERILEVAKRRYESGSITQVDYLNAEVSLYSTQNDLNDLMIAEKSSQSQLNVLLGHAAEQPLEIEPIPQVTPSSFSRPELESKMASNRPEIRAATHTAQAADQSRKLAWMSLLPDFQFQVGTTFYNLPGATPVNINDQQINHTYLAQIQMTIPLWFLVNERESIVAASHDHAAAEANLTSVQFQSRISLETNLQTLDGLAKKIENYENRLVPLAEQSFSLALANYSIGKVDFASLSLAAINRRNSQRDYCAAVINYLITRATLGQLIGEDL